MNPTIFKNATAAWYNVLHTIFNSGTECSPRGMNTLEVLHNTTAMDMNYPVVHSVNRKLSFKFLAAEAHWILSGDNRVENIAPFNKNISAFSDDGKIFAGAYGPPIREQLPYVVSSLENDEDTRQAVLTIWKSSPGKSKDIPCTIAMTFNIRDKYLNCHVFMRSSDAWLGFPYDVFNFSMVAATVTALLNQNTRANSNESIQLGTLYWSAASSHLYEQHYDKAKHCLENDPTRLTKELHVPKYFLMNPESILSSLDGARHCEDVYPWNTKNAT